MSNDLMRFSVAMPEELLVRFDQLVARRGLAKNRSEVVRDLVRDALVEDECSTPGMEVVGTLTIVFDHHASDLQEKLHAIQHDYFESIISSMHVHLDAHHCLEVIVLRGETGLVQDIANLILGTKGVKNGRLVVTTTGQHIRFRRPTGYRNGSTLRLPVSPDLAICSLSLAREARAAAKRSDLGRRGNPRRLCRTGGVSRETFVRIDSREGQGALWIPRSCWGTAAAGR